MTGHSVEKIGGTSMAATATLFDNVLIAGRSGADLYNRIFVVSAYGGMTDLLLENKKSGVPGVYGRFVADEDVGGWREAMEDVRRAMHERNAGMFARPRISTCMPPIQRAPQTTARAHQRSRVRSTTGVGIGTSTIPTTAVSRVKT